MCSILSISRVANFLIISPKEVGVVVVGAGLVQEAEEVIESLPGRLAGGAVHSQSPFADNGGFVADRLERLCDRVVLRPKGKLAAETVRPGFVVAADGAVTGVKTGHQRGPGRCANGTPGVVIGEHHPPLGEAVDIGRDEFGLAVAAQVAVSQIVGQNVDDVRFSRPGRLFCRLDLV